MEEVQHMGVVPVHVHTNVDHEQGVAQLLAQRAQASGDQGLLYHGRKFLIVEGRWRPSGGHLDEWSAYGCPATGALLGSLHDCGSGPLTAVPLSPCYGV